MRPSLLLILFVACSRPSVIVDTRVSEQVRTVVEVDLRLGEGRHWIAYGPNEALGHETPVILGETEQTVRLLGMRQASDVWFRLMREVDGEVVEGPLQTLRTGTLPAWLPRFEATGEDIEGYVLVSIIDGENNGLWIIDGHGQVGWYHHLGDALVYLEAQFDIHRPAEPFEVLAMVADQDYEVDLGAIERIDAGGQTLERITASLAHHAFTQGPGSDLSWIAFDIRELEGVGQVLGDVLMRYNGTDSFPVRSTWELFDAPDAEELAIYEDYLDLGEDWTHANDLVWSEERQSYLLSLRNKHTVIELGETGLERMRLGPDGDWEFAKNGEEPFEQHGPTWTPEGSLIMMSLETLGTRVVEYSLDTGTQVATLIWHYGLDDNGHMYVLGGVEPIHDGSLLLNWGNRGMLQAFIIPQETIGINAFRGFWDVRICSRPL